MIRRLSRKLDSSEAFKVYKLYLQSLLVPKMSAIYSSALAGSQTNLIQTAPCRATFKTASRSVLCSRRRLVCKAEEKSPEAPTEAGWFTKIILKPNAASSIVSLSFASGEIACYPKFLINSLIPMQKKQRHRFSLIRISPNLLEMQQQLLLQERQVPHKTPRTKASLYLSLRLFSSV